MFMAGNSAKDKKIVSQLAKDVAFTGCYDFDGDEKIQLLEKFTLTWINLAIFQKLGRDIAFKVIKKYQLCFCICYKSYIRNQSLISRENLTCPEY